MLSVSTTPSKFGTMHGMAGGSTATSTPRKIAHDERHFLRGSPLMALSWREREVLIKAARRRIELWEQAKRVERKREALRKLEKRRGRT